jgi:hypothetical protein
VYASIGSSRRALRRGTRAISCAARSFEERRRPAKARARAQALHPTAVSDTFLRR